MDERWVVGLPILVENVLKHFAAVDLLRMRRVCKLWKSVSDDILRYRSKRMFVDVFHAKIPCTEEDNVDLSEEGANLLGRELRAWRNSWVSLPSTIFIQHCLPAPAHDRMFHFSPESKVVSIPLQNISNPCSGVALGGFPASVSLDFAILRRSSNRDEEEKFNRMFRKEIDDPLSKFILVYVLNTEAMDWVYFDLKRAISGQKIDCGLICWSDGVLRFNPGGDQDYEECRAVAVSFKGHNVKTTSVCHDQPLTLEELDATFQNLSENVSRLLPGCKNHLQNCNKIGRCCVCESVTLCFMSAAGHDSNVDHFQTLSSSVTSLADVRVAFMEKFPNIPLFCGSGFFAADAFTSDTVSSGYTTIFSVVLLR